MTTQFGSFGLDQLSPLSRGRVVAVGGEEAMKCRLEELGVVKGTEIECLMVSPLGDPIAYRIRGSVIALRRKDARAILVVPFTEVPRV